MADWIIGEEHYGKLVMRRTIKGEEYTFFLKDELISMIPLSTLKLEEENGN